MTNASQGCTQNEVIVTQQDLPLSCPQQSERVWDGHPRVYLSFGNSDSVQCPYCGTVYKLASKPTQ